MTRPAGTAGASRGGDGPPRSAGADEAGVLAVLLAAAAALYLLTWLIEGPPSSQGRPGAAPAGGDAVAARP
jgi:hypothetical protein